jgi:hypothetical protein
MEELKMNVKVEKKENSVVEIEFTMDKEQFNLELDKAFKANAKKFNVPGFRKGMVPRAVVEKTYGEGVLYEFVIENTVDDAYRTAVVENQLDIVSRPELDIKQIGKDKDFIFVVTVCVKPEAKVKDYKGIEVKKVSIPVVNSKVISKSEKQVGYIYLSSFTKNSYNQFKDALETLEHENIDSLIIDLRDNTGGYLSGAQDIADLFIKKDKVVYTLEYKDSTKTIKTKSNDYRTYPIVVLVNEYTASASEVLALALKESYGATLVGTKTFGKGKVQVTSTLSDDTMIKYTTAKWYSPNNNSIDEKGITPGIVVNQSLDFILTKEGEDKQLDKALEFITK